MIYTKISNSFFFICFFVQLITNQMHGQCDYLTNTYEVRVESNIVYGEVETFDGQMLELQMDIYKPVGDNNINRPMCVWIHGGGFSGGSRQDMRLFCQSMASKGIVSATISYRLGFVRPEGRNYPFTYDEHEILRVVYRDMQDAKGAIRFMKSRHLLDSTDIHKVFVGGGSAGGFVALTAAYLNEDSNKPISCGNIEAINIGGVTTARPDLGDIDGSLHIGEYNASVTGVINIYGGLLDLEFIEPDENIYAFHYHQTLDPVVPCGFDQPYWGTPSVNDRYPYVFGSCEILKHYDELNIDNKYIESLIHDGNNHGIHDIGEFYQKLGLFMNKAICDTTTTTEVDVVLKATNYIFPNPAFDFIQIPKLKDISIINLNGVKQKFVTSSQVSGMRINISNFPNGIYIVKGIDRNGLSISHKMIKY